MSGGKRETESTAIISQVVSLRQAGYPVVNRGTVPAPARPRRAAYTEEPARGMDSGPGKLNPGTPQGPVPFGKYWLMGLIARGGMAEVYRARSRATGSQILAIKWMR